jgi:hypothetical protein
VNTRTPYPAKIQPTQHPPREERWGAVTRPGTRTRLHLSRQYRVRPAMADLIAALAGLGSAVDP